MQSPVQGGTVLWEKAQVAWEMKQSLPEFEERSTEQQDWLLAVWRTQKRVGAVESIEAEEARSK